MHLNDLLLQNSGYRDKTYFSNTSPCMIKQRNSDEAINQSDYLTRRLRLLELLASVLPPACSGDILFSRTSDLEILTSASFSRISEARVDRFVDLAVEVAISRGVLSVRDEGED